MAKKVGRPKTFKTPEILLKHFEDYVKWSTENPMHKNVLHQKTSAIVQIPLERPISFLGFQVYLNTNKIKADLSHYEINLQGRYGEFVGIIKEIKDFCYMHQTNGASVGIFNARIIAYKLGLVAKKEITQKGDINLDFKSGL